MKKKIVLLLFGLFFIFIVGGCSSNDGVADQIAVEDQEEIFLPNNKNQSIEYLTTEELREWLLESTGIELRDTENQSVGLLKDREAIFQFVEELFLYPKQEEFPNDSVDNGVIGPIHFYFNDQDVIYGLVKDHYIYLEGYYFLLTKEQGVKIENLFKNNIIQTSGNGV